MTAIWHGKSVTWWIDGEEFTAHYNPAEKAMMAVAKDRGATRAELEVLHMLKAVLDATIIDAQAAA